MYRNMTLCRAKQANTSFAKRCRYFSVLVLSFFRLTKDGVTFYQTQKIFCKFLVLDGVNMQRDNQPFYNTLVYNASDCSLFEYPTSMKKTLIFFF